jgi:hypothetical protein
VGMELVLGVESRNPCGNTYRNWAVKSRHAGPGI